MQKYLTLIAVLSSLCNFSQPNTEVFLFDLNQANGTFQLSKVKNISENEGYDNQPSFLNTNTILYAGTRNGQIDIVKYDISNGQKIWVCETEGGEYSPLKIPNQDAVSAVRLDKDGKQVLRKYRFKNGESEVLIDDIVIGYYVWFKGDILASAVLEVDYLSLYISNLSENKNYKHQIKIGRSLHTIPNSNLVSYISKENDSIWEIKSLDPTTGEIKLICETLPQSEDMCWLSPDTILMGKDDKLYKFKLNKDEEWIEVVSLSNYGISNITRLSINSDGTKLALVGDLTND